MGGEHWFAVTDQGLGQAVNPDHVLHEQGRHIGSSHGFGSRDEDCLLRQAVYHHQNRVVIVAGRQVGDPVQRHREPGPGRDREGGEEAERRMADDLVALTGVAAADVQLHCSREARPLEILLHEGLRPRHAIVPRQK